MIESFSLFKKTKFIIGSTKKLPFLTFLFLASTLIDLLGISLIASYIAIIINPELLQESNTLRYVSIFFDLNSADGIIEVSVFLSLVFLFKAFFAIKVNRSILRFSHETCSYLRKKIFRIYNSIDYEDYSSRDSSSYVYNIFNLTQQFSILYLQSILRMFSETILLVLVFALIIYESPFAVLIFFILVLSATFIYDFLFGKKNTTYGKQINDSSTEILQFIKEAIQGYKEFKILKKENFLYEGFKRKVDIFSDSSINSGVISIIPKYFIEFLLVTFLLILVSVTIFLNGTLDHIIPTLGFFAAASIRVLPSINQINSSISRIRHSHHCVEILFKELTLNYEPNPKEQRSIKKFQKIRFENVGFKYKKNNSATIENLDLEISAGETIGIIGKSGSGKTTVLNLLLGLLKPSSGKIKINGEDLAFVQDSWMRLISYIPQEITILNGSLKSNVTLESEASVEDKKYSQSLNKAGVIEFMNRLDDNDETQLGENGIALSGGQRQRVAIARSLYHSKEIFVMDEATSALDNETKTEIMLEISRFKGTKTIIIVTHDHEILKDCDHVYTINNGIIKRDR